MVDEIYDRQYQAGRQQLHAAVGNAFGHLGRAVHDAFEVLVKIEYQSPWTVKAPRARSH